MNEGTLSSGSSPDWQSQTATEFPQRKSPPDAEATRELMDGFTAQQASLVRAVALGDPDYLNHSFYLDPSTNKRIAFELDPQEFARFSSAWQTTPLESIRAMNEAIAHLKEPSRMGRYLEAAVDVEVLMDRQTWVAGDGRVYRGIPMYLMNGYTDMGLLASPTERNGREKIKVDKERMRPQLIASKRAKIGGGGPAEELLARYYDAVRKDMQFDERGVDELSREFGSESIVLSEYLDKGLGVCRHLAIVYQIYLQEAGIPSRVVKGNLRFYIFNGRHAWNLVWLEGQVVLVDVTHPNVNRPFILLGRSEEEVYQRASKFNRNYSATPDDQNHYKIGN
jgi:hypothetical protein